MWQEFEETKHWREKSIFFKKTDSLWAVREDRKRGKMKRKRASGWSQAGQAQPTRSHGWHEWSPLLTCSLYGFCCLSHHFWETLFKKTYHLSGNHSSAYPTARCTSNKPYKYSLQKGQGSICTCNRSPRQEWSQCELPWTEFPSKQPWQGFKLLIWILLGYKPELNDLLDKRVRQKETKQAGGGCSYHFCSRRPFSCSGPAARCAQRHPRVLFQGQHQPQNCRCPDLDWNPKHMRAS